MKNKSFIKSVKNAFCGLLHAAKTERNVRIDIVIAVLTLIFAYAYGLDNVGWGVLILTICAVISAELFNTSLESLSDSVTEEYNEKIKFAKDIAAAAVTVLAVGAVLIGLALFLTDIDKFIMAILNIAFSKRALAGVIITVAAGAAFILLYKERKK